MKFVTLLRKKFVRATFIAVAVSAVITLMYALGVFDFLEFKAYDSMMVYTAENTIPSEDIMVILLDQESLDWAQEEFDWSWPWPRKAYADMVRFLADGGANSFAFDVMYTEPSIYGDEDDLDFAAASEAFSGTIHTVFLSDQYGNNDEWPEDTNTPVFTTQNFDEKKIAELSPEMPALFPIKELRQTAGVIGNVTSTFDSDDIIRRTNLFYPVNGKAVPALGFASLLAREGKSEELVYNEKTKTVSLLGREIPVDDEYKPYLRFRGDLDRYIPYNAYQILSSWYAIQNGEEPLLEPHDFSGKYVFFGFYAPGLFDFCTTPISTVYPGVGVHITLLDNFLQGDFITKMPQSFVFLCIFLAAMVGSLAVVIASKVPLTRKHPIPFSFFAVLVAACALLGASIFLFTQNFWLPLVSPLMASAFGYIISLLADYALEGKQKKYLKSAFKQYLSPFVIEELIANPDRLKLGGERKEISIFFSDVQGFTSISEKLSPEDLTSLLNDYLSAMTDVILESGGTIDKYEGDAIIAFWNAPLYQEDHAKRALDAAMKCQAILTEMRQTWAVRSKMPLFMRIGLNTGSAVVGNMGSKYRFDYTMLGDSVNLAARLEGQNKQFGIYTMCTEAMVNAAVSHGCTKKFRELAKLAVVGKTEAVKVFQPLEIEEYESMKDFLPIFDEGRNLFYAGELEKALNIFEKIQDVDAPSLAYAQKCKTLLASDLSNWPKGVWIADSK